MPCTGLRQRVLLQSRVKPRPLTCAAASCTPGVPKDASDKQITAAYKKLALKFHPDRNIDDSYAAAKYEAVITAYQTLIDPTKKALYDTRHEPSAPAPPTEAESVDVSGLGGLGRVFGAVMSRLGRSRLAISRSPGFSCARVPVHIFSNGLVPSRQHHDQHLHCRRYFGNCSAHLQVGLSSARLVLAATVRSLWWFSLAHPDSLSLLLLLGGRW